MIRQILSWLTMLVCAACLVMPASAQNPTGSKDRDPKFSDTRWKDDSGAPGLPTLKDHVPVGEYIMAACGVGLVLMIVCSPSRKR